MPITFKRLNNAGNGHFKQKLGSVGAGTYYVTAVELEFKVPTDVSKQYRNLELRQYAGPDCIWKKTDHPITGKWILVGFNNKGSNRDDDPLPTSVFKSTGLMGFYDQPGPNMTKYVDQQISRLYVVQLFTAWVQGINVHTGEYERLCPVVGWYSKVNMGNGNWQDPDSVPDWQWVHPNGSGLGWIPTNVPPDI